MKERIKAWFKVLLVPVLLVASLGMNWVMMEKLQRVEYLMEITVRAAQSGSYYSKKAASDIDLLDRLCK